MVAIRDVPNYDKWAPQTENVVDMRLGIFADMDRENEVIAEASNEMGQNLTELYTQASYISFVGLQALREKSPLLRVLNLCCAYKVADASLQVVAGFSELEELNLHYASYDPNIVLMGNVARSADPTQISVITDAGIRAVLEGCPKLSKIDLSGTRITAVTLERIAGLHNIKVVRLSGCWDLKPEDIAKLIDNRPDLRVETEEPGATEAFQSLAKAVKPRYYREVPSSTGGYYVRLPDHVAKSEARFIAPSVFVNL